MTRGLFLLVAGWLTIAGGAAVDAQTAGLPQAAGTAASSESPQRALLDRYCVTCHNQRLQTGGLALDNIDVSKVAEDAEVWEKVVRKLRGGLMPPAGRPRPEKAAYDGFAAWLETEVDTAAAIDPNPGRTEAVHRLNRRQYHNVIRDLLALDIDVIDLLPADDTSYGFDNIAGALAVSPTLLERYLSAARKIARLAVAAPVPSATAETFRVRSDLPQEDRLDGLPFGTRGGAKISYNFPEDAEYVIQVEPTGRPKESHEIEVTIDGERVQLFTVEPPSEDQRPGYETETADLEVRLPVRAGPREIGVAFIKKTNAEVETLRQPFLRPYGGQLAQPKLESVTVTGPFEASGSRPVEGTPSRSQIFVCRPAASASPEDEASCAAEILSTLARRAYRRPVTDVDLQGLLDFYDEGWANGGFETGIEAALRRLLVSSEFIFRIERDAANVGPNTSYRISDLELASRLSFFFWNSIPDDELLDLAIQGTLTEPAVLEKQARRMLADQRSEALVSSFVAQWLLLSRVDVALPDQYLFPDFDQGLREAMVRETELFIESLMRDDRSVLDLLSANYTFVDERLARHYGIPNVYGSHFRRITFSDDSPRRGLLGQGSVLTLTSYPGRTSPVVRGKFILDNILGTPPPPPPPNVPDLEETPSDRVLTMRERMEQHRANPVCASCHRMMDPLGLSLENFDAVGRWRDTMDLSTSNAIDVAGVFPDGTEFEGVDGLRNLLLSRPDQFVANVAERMLIYALGRGLEHYDMPAVREIRRETGRNNYSFSSLILGIVNSTPFQMRRSQS